MPGFFTQLVGETIDYQVSISGDTIVSVTWTCGPGASVATIDSGVGRTSTTGRLTTNAVGRLTLKVLIKIESGQTVGDEARIIVSA